MTAQEIRTYGEAMLNVPDQLFFLMWEYDANELWADGVTIGADYFDSADYQEAFNHLADIASNL